MIDITPEAVLGGSILHAKKQDLMQSLQVLFVISNPDVYRSPTSNTWM
jgi:hypothetical protein